MEMHSFDKNIAKLTNVNCAIILQNIFYWVEKNKANNTHLHDGRYWTYNSMKAFEELFPYLNSRQIRYALETLEKEGLILTGNFNDTCTRTLWYTVTDKAVEIITGKITEKSFQPKDDETVLSVEVESEEIVIIDDSLVEENEEKLQNCQYEVTKLSNSNDKIVNTYLQNCQYGMTKLSNHTNNKQHIYTTDNIEKEIYKEKEDTTDEVVSVFNYWNEKSPLKCEELTKSLRNIIKSIIKIHKLEDIKLYISRYSEMYNNKEYYFNYIWSLKNFLCQRNAMKDFKDKGEKWVNYQTWLKGNIKQDKFIHNSYTSEQINKLTNIDLSEVPV